ncbi:MAG: hypothetical protein ACYC2P_01790 [Paludibacteraceae bacterium]
MKFSHLMLEQIRRNPGSTKEILTNIGRGSFSMNSAWKNAVKKYHQTDGNRHEAFQHFDRMFDKNFVLNDVNNRKKGLLIEKLDYYIENYNSLHFNYYNYSYRISIDIRHGNFITGEIFRLDKVKKGYAVTIFQKEDHIWLNELRFPLLQIHYSNILNCPFDEVKVGIYNFEKNTHEYVVFDENTLRQAQQEAFNISNDINKVTI